LQPCCVATFISTASDIYLFEPFTQDPIGTGGWEVHGDPSLFEWDDSRNSLSVVWDSSRPNSYFHHPIGTALTRSNDFMLGFDLRLSRVEIGSHSGMPLTFQLSIGLLNLSEAITPGFLRGTGYTAPDLLEFSYFPDSGFGATVAPTIISSANDYNSGGFTYPLELLTGAVYHVEMRFIAAEQRLVTRVLQNGKHFGPINDALLGSSFGNFAVDQLAIMSYSDAGQDPMWAGSINAEGTIDNIFLMTPPPVETHRGGFSGNSWHTTVSGRSGWSYQLERSGDLEHWTAVGNAVQGTGHELVLSDPTPPTVSACYRVAARKD
jgi:hypothetical protein